MYTEGNNTFLTPNIKIKKNILRNHKQLAGIYFEWFE